MNWIIKFSIGGTLIVILLIRLGIILLSDLNFLVTTVSDDLFYYLNVAQNIAGGFGTTFDRLNFTNGYHPLWMATVVLLAKVISGKEVLLRVSLIAQFLFWLAGLRLIYKSFEGEKNTNYSMVGLAAILPLFYPRYVSVLLSGLESALTFFLVVVLLRSIRFITPKTHMHSGKIIALSLLLSLIFLSRLDSIFMIIAVASYLSFIILFSAHSSDIPRKKRIVALFVPLGGVISVYFFWNITQFGHTLPISGSLKSTFPSTNLNLDYLFSYPEWLIVSFVIIVVYAAFWRSEVKGMPPALPMLVFGVGLLGHALYTLFFMKWAVFSWHFIIVLPGLAFITGDVVSWFSNWLSSAKPSVINNPRMRPLLPLASISIAVVLLVGQFYALSTPDIWHQASYQAAMEVRDSFPSDSVLAMKDSGIFGYFSERNVVNLDGVINSYEYQEFLSNGEINYYLCSLNVSYIAQHRLGSALSRDFPELYYDQFTLDLPSRLHGGESQLKFFPDAEVYRKEYIPDNFSFALDREEVNSDLFVIWQIQPCDG